MLFKFSGIQRFQVFRQENSVFADQFAVEPDFAAAPFRALDQHHVPVAQRNGCRYRSFLISLSRREVQRAGDFSSNRMSHIGFRMNGLNPSENSPM